MSGLPGGLSCTRVTCEHAAASTALVLLTVEGTSVVRRVHKGLVLHLLLDRKHLVGLLDGRSISQSSVRLSGVERAAQAGLPSLPPSPLSAPAQARAASRARRASPLCPAVVEPGAWAGLLAMSAWLFSRSLHTSTARSPPTHLDAGAGALTQQTKQRAVDDHIDEARQQVVACRSGGWVHVIRPAAGEMDVRRRQLPAQRRMCPCRPRPNLLTRPAGLGG